MLPSPNATVWGRGACEPGGTGWSSAPIAQDGTFNLRMDDATEAGQLHLQDAHHWSKPVGTRSWQTHAIELIAVLGDSHVVTIKADGVDLTGLTYQARVRLGRVSKYMAPVCEGSDRSYSFALPLGSTSYFSITGLDFPPLPAVLKKDPTSKVTRTTVLVAAPALIKGRLLDSSGQPIPYSWVRGGIEFKSKTKPRSVNRRNFPGSWNAKGNEQGKFTLPVLPHKPLWITGQANGYQYSFVLAEPLAPGQVLNIADFRLEPMQRLHGTLVDTNSQPIVNARIQAGESWNLPGVNVDDLGASASHVQYTDQNGKFSLRWNSASRPSIAVLYPLESAGQGLRIGADTKIQYYDSLSMSAPPRTFVFDPQPAGLKGEILDEAGQPVPNFTIRCDRQKPSQTRGFGCCTVVLESPSPYDPNPDRDRFDLFGITYYADFAQEFHSTEGHFDWAQLPEGTWNVSVEAPGFCMASSDDVRTPNAIPLKINLRASGQLTVQVFDGRGMPRAHASIYINGPSEKKESTHDSPSMKNYKSPMSMGS